MKRKRTELEENLIKNGWELDHKTYTGKHSDIVLHYVYQKVYVKEYERDDGKVIVNTELGEISLDSKRTHIEEVTIRVPSGRMFNRLALAYWYSKVLDIEEEVKNCYPTKNEELSNEEVVQSVEAIESE